MAEQSAPGMDAGRPTGEGTPKPPWLQGVQGIARFLFGRFRAVQGAVIAALGAVLLINAWHAGPARWRERRALNALTARGVANVERAWWRVDFDPRPLGADGTNWPALTAPELCVALRVKREGDSPVPAVYCRRWQQLASGGRFTSGAELAPGVPVVWSDPQGRPMVDLRFSERAWRWLSARPPSKVFLFGFRVGDRAERVARSEFDVVWVAVDDPLSRLAEVWAAPRERTIPVAYDPSRPSRVLPEAVLADALRPDPAEMLLPVMLALGGLAFWGFGGVLLLAGLPRVVVAAVIVATVALVPWWGDRAARAIGSVWEPAGGFVDFFARELVKGPPAPILREPSYDGEPGDVRRPWTPETSVYAKQLAGLRLERPEGTADAPTIRRALADSVRARVPEPSREIEELLEPVEW